MKFSILNFPFAILNWGLARTLALPVLVWALSGSCLLGQSVGTPIFNLPTANSIDDTNWIAVLTNPNATNGTKKAHPSDLLQAINEGNTIYVRTNGNDSTGQRGRYSKPFATPAAAKAAAQEGDLIIVAPGTYTGAGVSNLFKAGKLTWLLQDPVFDYIDLCTNFTTGSGIFDDRFAGGAVSNTVLGSVKLRYCSGTNVVYDAGCGATYDIATNHLAAIVVTNALSEIQWSAHADIRHWGQVGHPFAIWVANCRPLTYFKNIDLVTNGAPGVSFSVSNCPAAPGVPIDVAIGANGFYWQLGTFTLQFGRAAGFTSYALDAYGVTNTDAANMTVSGDFVDGKFYIVGMSKDWKVWSRITEMRNTSDNPNLIEMFNGGSHYFESQKMSTKGGTVISMSTPGASSDTNLVVWVDVLKASGSNGWLNVVHGALRGRIAHFDQNGPNTGAPGIFATNISALVDLSGEAMYCANTAISHGGGRTILHNYQVYTTNRDPILITGSGFRMHNLVVVTPPAATNSVRSAAGQTIGAYGMNMLRSNINANITVSTGTTNITVSATID